MMLRPTFVLLAALVFAGCDKDVESKCTELNSALVADNEEKILEVVNRHITQSLRLANNSQNFEALVKYIDDQCNLGIKYKCFECIDTNPPISEIAIQFYDGVILKEKTIDFWEDPQDHRMKAISVH